MYLIYHPSFMEHAHWPGHPERPERLAAIKQYLERNYLWKEPVDIEPMPPEMLSRIHSPEYIGALRSRGPGSLDPDTSWNENTYEIALMALGGAYTASKRTLASGETGLCLLRPPGHHAGPDYFKGFCYFNNAALAAETIIQEGKKRVAVVDLDVHHGNGTNDIMAQRSDVLYVSTHHWGIFPGTGHYTDRGQGEGEGYNVNIPLPTRSGDATFKMAMDHIIEPVLEEYKPEYIVVSIGADTHYMDPLAGLVLSSQGHLENYRRMIDISKKLCDGRIIFILEGGYDLVALSETTAGLVAMLDDHEPPPIVLTRNRDEAGEGAESVEEARKAHAETWGI